MRTACQLVREHSVLSVRPTRGIVTVIKIVEKFEIGFLFESLQDMLCTPYALCVGMWRSQLPYIWSIFICTSKVGKSYFPHNRIILFLLMFYVNLQTSKRFFNSWCKRAVWNEAENVFKLAPKLQESPLTLLPWVEFFFLLRWFISARMYVWR